MDTKFKRKRNKNRYHFENNRDLSLGFPTMQVPIINNLMLTERVDVHFNMPFRIGVELMDKCKMAVNNVKNVLHCPYFGCKLPLAQKLGRFTFSSKDITRFYTRIQNLLSYTAISLNRPQINRSTFWNLIDLGKLIVSRKNIPKDITARCNTCKRFTHPPTRSKVSSTTKVNIVFAEELSLDLRFQDGKAVSKVVEADPHFSAATFQDEHGAKYG